MAGERDENGAGKEGEKRVPRSNHLVSRKKFREFVASHPEAKQDADVLLRWCKTVESADWRAFADVRTTYGSADSVAPHVVFNVGGNKYRVVATIKYKSGKPAWVYIRHVLTHKEYDKGDRRRS